jgi:hypothetical protein
MVGWEADPAHKSGFKITKWSHRDAIVTWNSPAQHLQWASLLLGHCVSQSLQHLPEGRHLKPRDEETSLHREGKWLFQGRHGLIGQESVRWSQSWSLSLFFFFPARENSMVELGPDLTYKWTQGCWQEFCDLPCVDLVNARAVSAKYAGDPRLPASLQDWVITHGNLCCPSNVRTIDLASPSWGNTFRSASDFASGLIL